MDIYYRPASEADLETERLFLEPMAVGHAAKLFDLFQDSRLCFIGRPRSVAELKERYRKWTKHGPNDGKQVWLNWAAKGKETGAYIGWFQASIYSDGTAGLAYVVFPAFWRKGYGTEGCRRMMTHLIEVYGTDLFFIEMDIKNSSSIALAERLGFTRRDEKPSEGEWRYELRRKDKCMDPAQISEKLPLIHADAKTSHKTMRNTL
jgi:RimJ/RimL family protein N-acetyltransferase